MKVMIVDDSNLLQTRLVNSLRKIDERICISQAYSCKEALKFFPEYVPDIVILDIELPDGSGIHLLDQFKKSDPMVFVVMLTNYSTMEFRKPCMELGADRFFDKSNITELLIEINEKSKSLNLLL